MELHSPQTTILGGVELPYAAVSTDQTLTARHYFVKVDCSGGNREITLPASAGLNVGHTLRFKKGDDSANTLTILPNAGQDIDGGAELVIEFAGRAVGVVFNDAGDWDVD